MICRVRDRKAALNFITVTPRQLIEKEGKEAKSVRVNVFTREVKSNRDLLGHKEDFRVNAQYLMATATVGPDPIGGRIHHQVCDGANGQCYCADDQGKKIKYPFIK